MCEQVTIPAGLGADAVIELVAPRRAHIGDALRGPLAAVRVACSRAGAELWTLQLLAGVEELASSWETWSPAVREALADVLGASEEDACEGIARWGSAAGPAVRELAHAVRAACCEDLSGSVTPAVVNRLVSAVIEAATVLRRDGEDLELGEPAWDEVSALVREGYGVCEEVAAQAA